MNAHDLKPYPHYRESGVPWLGLVPKHWDVRRLKTLTKVVDKRSVSGDEVLLSMRKYHGLVPYHEHFNKPPQAATLVGFKIVEPGCVVLNRMQAGFGLFFASKYHGLVSPDFAVFKPNGEVAPRYLEELCRSHETRAEFHRESKGLGTGQSGFMRLYDDRFGTIHIPLPPKVEQETILHFLDALSRKVNRFIRNRRRLIEVLNEQKQAIIDRAITRGLDPTVKLKPSGIDWLGDVPEHWVLLLNQRIFKETIRPHNDLPEIPLSLSQVDGLIATVDMQERSLKTASYDKWKVAVPGDLVVNRFKAHLGVFFASTLRGIVSFHYGVFQPRVPLVTKYYELLYHINAYRAIYAGRSNGMTVGLQNLSNQNFYSVRTLLPPLSEQEQIVRFAETATTKQDEVIQRSKNEIALVQEYRTRLIADVVTGKVDVRHLAAELGLAAESWDDGDALHDDVDAEDLDTEEATEAE